MDLILCWPKHCSGPGDLKTLDSTSEIVRANQHVIWTSGATAARFAFFLCWDLRPCFFEMPKNLFQSHPQSDYSKNYGARMDGPPLNQASRTSPFWEFVSQGLGKIASDFIIAACNSNRKPTTFQTRAAGVYANSVPAPRLRK